MALRDEMVKSGNFMFRWRSYLPLLFLPVVLLALRGFEDLGGSETVDAWWEAVCGAVAASGIVVRALTVGFVSRHTSGRGTKRQVAERLNTSGMYSLLRHPLYLGNFLIWMGIALFPHTLWLPPIAILSFWIYYERIMMAEEEFLRARFGADFEEWARRTPALVPAWRNWQAPDIPYSWRAVLAREHATLLATVLTLFLLEVAGDYFAGKLTHADLAWIVVVSVTVVAYVTLRLLKKRGLLAVEGR